MQAGRTNEEILATLAQAWSTRPDWRLCQLINNAIRDDPSPPSLYDYEDDDLADRLIAYCGVDVTAPESARRDELLSEKSL